MGSYRHIIYGMVLGSMLFASLGCREKLTPETPDYVEYGWDLMLEENYREAIVQFEVAVSLDEGPTFYADSWNGLGWAYARLGSADTSKTNFTRGIALDDTTDTGTEVLAGRAFVNLALAEHAEAVSDAKAALVLDAAWTFSRDQALTYEHLILTAATAFYGLAEFDSCYAWIRKLEPEFALSSPGSLPGRAALADKLEEWDNLL